MTDHPDMMPLEIPHFLRRSKKIIAPDVESCDCADRAPASGAAYICPKCDAQWPEEAQ